MSSRLCKTRSSSEIIKVRYNDIYGRLQFATKNSRSSVLTYLYETSTYLTCCDCYKQVCIKKVNHTIYFAHKKTQPDPAKKHKSLTRSYKSIPPRNIRHPPYIKEENDAKFGIFSGSDDDLYESNEIEEKEEKSNDEKEEKSNDDEIEEKSNDEIEEKSNDEKEESNDEKEEKSNDDEIEDRDLETKRIESELEIKNLKLNLEIKKLKLKKLKLKLRNKESY